MVRIRWATRIRAGSRISSIRALRGEPITIFGDGWQVRDILYVDDAVDAYLAAWRNIAHASRAALTISAADPPTR